MFARNNFARVALVVLAAVCIPCIAQCSEHGEGVSAAATVVFSIGQFPITDSVIMSWAISLLIILAVKFSLRGEAQIIPPRGQAMIESLVGGLRDIVEPVVGRKAFGIVFPCLLGYFFFILLQNLGGLLPGVGSIGIYSGGEFKPFFRPANADLNATLALAVVAFFAWAYYCLRCAGVRGMYFEIFGNKADKSEISSFVYGALFFVFLGVGLIECISILCRIISLSFRLFGNTFGGENLLHNMYGFSSLLKNIPVVNYLSYLIPLPFYFLEFLVAIIQSFVFTLLLSVYIGLVCNHGDHEKEILKKEEYGYNS
ncbi:MAG: F0F1 ATP synthase subunit A [Puniceicoccales bacterium]|jgi:F-type H+-transporting ATPase subunit a|nr:F0F1 ATP synthase subunit A [Puniceicoccales bacterium]